MDIETTVDKMADDLIQEVEDDGGGDVRVAALIVSVDRGEQEGTVYWNFQPEAIRNHDAIGLLEYVNRWLMGQHG